MASETLRIAAALGYAVRLLTARVTAVNIARLMAQQLGFDRDEIERFVEQVMKIYDE